jgi:hypothetical protein
MRPGPRKPSGALELTMAEKKHKSWDHAYLVPLIGGEIVATGVSSDGFPKLTVKNGDKIYHLEVSQDPEGNGPGFLFGLPRPAPGTYKE